MSAAQKMGFDRIEDAIRKGEPLSELVKRLLSEAVQPFGAGLLIGAAECLIGVFCALRGHGVKSFCAPELGLQSFLEGTPERMRAEWMQAISAGRIDEARRMLLLLCSTLEQWHGRYTFTVTPAPAQGANALPVRLVGMPERVTETAVLRDSDMEIISTTTRQFDAARAA